MLQGLVNIESRQLSDKIPTSGDSKSIRIEVLQLNIRTMEKELETSLVISATPEFISRRIYQIRSQKVMLDTDLAELYQVPTKRLNEQVKRNARRFPKDFMFRLTSLETKSLNWSQFATSSRKHRGSVYRQYVFTELGVSMLSSVLKSDRAVQMNIFIMRAFVKLRELLATHKDLARKIEQLEKEQREQGKDITAITIAVNKLLAEKKKLQSAIGFKIGK
jgi:hypothetical protein